VGQPWWVLRWANRISTFLRSSRDLSNSGVPISARAVSVGPVHVTRTDLKNYREVIVADRLRKDPEKTWDSLLWCWNSSLKIEGWLSIRSNRPKRELYVLPWSQLPAALMKPAAFRGYLLPHSPHVRLYVHRFACRGGLRFSDDRRLPSAALEIPGDRIGNEARALGVHVAVAKAALTMGEEALRQHEMKLISGAGHGHIQ
jgi:hypothetical protein